jgi:AraC-like DNA-binding protein
MIVLPVPMFVALVLAFLLLRALMRGGTQTTLLALIGVCTLQSAILALTQHYGVAALRYVQPVTATLIPPLAWLAFISVARRPVTLASDWLHALGPAIVLFCSIFARPALDIAIPLLFLAYGAAILHALASGEEDLPHSRLENGAQPLTVWRVLAASLIASALCDVFIAVSFAFSGGAWQPFVFGLVSALSLLSLGGLSLSHSIEGKPGADAEIAPIASHINAVEDQTLMARLEELMASQRLFLDPDLTLSRLARRLTVPAKQLSGAINRACGENVSRYVNRLRVEHACRLMREGKNVTAAMLDSGFNTKSNFNREFLRLKLASPSKWLEAQR